MSEPNPKTNHPKQHHYLPRFYLDGFCASGGFWVYDIERGTYRNGSPTDTAKQRYYYALVAYDGERDLRVEQWLSGIESDAAEVIRKIERREQFGLEEKTLLALFMAAQHLRTPNFEAQVNKTVEHFTDLASGRAWGTVEAAEETLKFLEAKKGEKLNLTAEEMVKFYRHKEAKLVISRNASLQAMMEMVGDLAEILAISDWTLLMAPEKKSFVTTDAPVIISAPKGWDPAMGSGKGYAIKGARKWMPLTPRVCLSVGDPAIMARMTYSAATPEVVRAINLNLAASTFRYVIAREEPLLKSIVGAMLEQVKRGWQWGGCKVTIS